MVLLRSKSYVCVINEVYECVCPLLGVAAFANAFVICGAQIIEPVIRSAHSGSRTNDDPASVTPRPSVYKRLTVRTVAPLSLDHLERGLCCPRATMSVL